MNQKISYLIIGILVIILGIEGYVVITRKSNKLESKKDSEIKNENKNDEENNLKEEIKKDFELMWQKEYDGIINPNDVINDISKTKDGGVIEVGIIGGKGFVIKYTENGDIVWENNLDEDIYYEIKEVEQGGYIAVGTKKGNAIIAKYNENGKLEWQKIWETELSDNFTQMIEVKDGYLTVGMSLKVPFADESSLIYKNNIVKYSYDGNLIWEKIIETSNNVETTEKLNQEKYNIFWEINDAKSTDDGIVIVGNAALFGCEDMKESRARGCTITSEYNGMIMKVDSNGNIEWKEHYKNSSGDGSFSQVEITDDNEYIIIGKTFQNNGFIVKYNESGEMVWKKEEDDKCFEDIERYGKSYILVGKTGNKVIIEKRNSDGNTEINNYFEEKYVQFSKLTVTNNKNIFVIAISNDNNQLQYYTLKYGLK